MAHRSNEPSPEGRRAEAGRQRRISCSQSMQRTRNLRRRVGLWEKDAAFREQLLHVRQISPEVTMISIGGQRWRTAWASLIPSIEPGMLTS